MAKDLLLEIGTEEIPAGYIPAALRQLQNDLAALLEREKVAHGAITVWGTPRRLAILAAGVAEKQPDIKTEVTGPPKQIAYDADGNLTAAGMGFAKKQNVKPTELKLKKTEKGEYLCVSFSQKGRLTKQVLAAALPQLVQSLYFPKTMRWESGGLRFARPLRYLLCLWGDSTLAFKLGSLSSSNRTRGHLILAGNREAAVKTPAAYVKTLAKLKVIVDQAERKKIIESQINKLAAKKGKIEQDLANYDLLETVTNLTEYPTAIMGRFDDKYLNLPKEVLITCMRHHQKYFSLTDGKGKLLPYFIGISNGDPRSAAIIREGYERVLAARLNDAEFYYKVDTQAHLEENVEKLKGVTFQEKLGSLFQKTERIMKLSEYICSQLPFTCYNLAEVRRAALLCKADLVSEMVKEFPELQGIMGREYAKLYNEKAEVGDAIFEHYLPLSVTGLLPRTVPGAMVSIADKMDTIIGDFLIGLVPTSSADPYALRRQAQGIIRIMLDQKWNFSLFELIEKEIRILRESGLEVSDSGDLLNKAWKFFRERLEYILGLEPYNLAYDEIAAVLDAGYSEVHNTLKRAQAIHALRHLPDFEPIAAGFKRANNILRQARDKKLLIEGNTLDEGKLSEEAEKLLHQNFTRVKAEVEKLLAAGEFELALKELVSLRESIDRFFEKVMVMVDDRDLLNNRLTLLKDIAGLFLRIADFSKLVISS
jgi:glycyl-tRNA synthetase beta chain